MKKITVSLLLTLVTPVALAHSGHSSADSLAHGLLHPLAGLDHLLAMLAVGLWAAQLGGQARWALPVSFIGVMLVGGLLALAGVALPLVEPGIAGSVLVFGALVALGRRVPLALGVALTGVFAVFHGYAHGAEMVPGNNVALYALGFVLATAALHGTGLLAGWLTRRQAGLALRWSGALVAVAGVALLGG